MDQLKCVTQNCIHNLKGHCNASVIGVNEKGVCATRMKRVGGVLEQTFAELEVAEEFLQSAPAIIQCDADCVFNRDKRCTATSIYIKDKMFNARCQTRLEE